MDTQQPEVYKVTIIWEKKYTYLVVQVYVVTLNHCVIVILIMTATTAWIEKPFITDTPFK